MITREEYDEAERIVLAYQRQILTVIGSVRHENLKCVKSLDKVESGDYIECTFVHSASKNHLTKGKKYEVTRRKDFRNGEGRFEILTDSNKKKFYYTTNQHFKVV